MFIYFYYYIKVEEKMGIINVKVDDEVEMDFRRGVLAAKGKKKGALGKAVEEAMIIWLEKRKKQGQQ